MFKIAFLLSLLYSAVLSAPHYVHPVYDMDYYVDHYPGSMRYRYGYQNYPYIKGKSTDKISKMFA